jgi:RNA polymerase sigma factor (sigma-70 family)
MLGGEMANGADPWRAWLAEHGAALLLLARQWTDCRADAEDVVQEAFVKFWRTYVRPQRDETIAIEEPAAYLYACVKRCALDWHRGRSRQRRREQAAARPESEALFAGTLEQDERRTAIESALRGLPDNQAEVLILKIWGGLSFPQIAAPLEISENTAASRYRYALAKLREQLAEEPIL